MLDAQPADTHRHRRIGRVAPTGSSECSSASRSPTPTRWRSQEDAEHPGRHHRTRARFQGARPDVTCAPSAGSPGCSSAVTGFAGPASAGASLRGSLITVPGRHVRRCRISGCTRYDYTQALLDATPVAVSLRRQGRRLVDDHDTVRLATCLRFFSPRSSLSDLPDFFDWCWRGDVGRRFLLLVVSVFADVVSAGPGGADCRRAAAGHPVFASAHRQQALTSLRGSGWMAKRPGRTMRPASGPSV